MRNRKRVLVVGLGTMGMSHARAYARIDGFDVVGLCSRGIRAVPKPPELAQVPQFSSFEEALSASKPDAVSINTLPDTHADFAIKALKAGGTSVMEPADMFYGDRSGGVTDPAGNHWHIGTHVEDVSPAELKKRATEFMKQQNKAA